jgi:hypothetical protein
MKKIAVNAKERYFKPTPKRWRKIGDSILGLGTLLTTVSAVTGANPVLIVSSAILTYIGKTLTNFTTKD